MSQIIKQLQPYLDANNIFSLYKDEKNAVFLDSSLNNQKGRFSIIGISPYLSLINGETFTVNGKVCSEEFPSYLKEYLEHHKEENPTTLPLVAGGIGYLSYDFGLEMEGLTSKHKESPSVPLCIFHFYDCFIIEDHLKKETWLIANGKNQDAGQAIAKMERDIANLPSSTPMQSTCYDIDVTSDFTKEEYCDAVKQMINYIIEGDIYIANMTRQLRIKSPKAPYDVFQTLRKINPSPFGGYLNYGDFQIISASPERFLQMKDGIVETRPIKGTRKRGVTKKEDQILKEELLASEKDKSELLMIVDLERNDLHKICLPGSVTVKELFAPEAYATVFHLVASIEGKLIPSKNAADLIYATFPGGSITGAPKRRTMEIIDILERHRRNIYTGSFGYISLDGAMDMNIIIRTALYQGECYTLGVGGGITYESELEFEYEETNAKARAILEAMK